MKPEQPGWLVTGLPDKHSTLVFWEERDARAFADQTGHHVYRLADVPNAHHSATDAVEELTVEVRALRKELGANRLGVTHFSYQGKADHFVSPPETTSEYVPLHTVETRWQLFEDLLGVFQRRHGVPPVVADVWRRRWREAKT